MFRRSGRSYGNATQTIANDPDYWDDLDRLDRVEFHPDDRDDHVNFEAIIWKRSQTTEAIETIIWKLPIPRVVRIVSKYFKTTGVIGTIRMIIWKPGLIVTKQLACFCSFAAALIAAKRSEFLDIEFYTDVLFYFGDGFQVILKIVVVRFRS